MAITTEASVVRFGLVQHIEAVSETVGSRVQNVGVPVSKPHTVISCIFV